MKSTWKRLSAAMLAAALAGIPAAAEEDGDVRLIIVQMEEILRNGGNRGRAEVESAIEALNLSLRMASLGEAYDYGFEDSGDSGLLVLEAPAAADDGGGESGDSGSNSSDSAAGDSGQDQDDPLAGGQEPSGADDPVFGVNDGSGTDEPDMGICDRGGEPAWCLDPAPAGSELPSQGAAGDLPFELDSEFGDSVSGEEAYGYSGDAWGMDDIWDIDGEIVVDSADGVGTDEPDTGICDRGGEPAWCGEG